MKLTLKQENIINRITDDICDYFNVNKSSIIGLDRRESAINAKTFIWYILHYEMKLSIKTISIVYEREMRSIYRGVAKIREGLKNQPYYRMIYDDLMNTVSPLLKAGTYI